jgi:hypothetical protein
MHAQAHNHTRRFQSIAVSSVPHRGTLGKCRPCQTAAAGAAAAPVPPVPPAHRKVRGLAMHQDEQLLVSCGDLVEGSVCYVLEPL